jgi:hypothetical protein
MRYPAGTLNAREGCDGSRYHSTLGSEHLGGSPGYTRFQAELGSALCGGLDFSPRKSLPFSQSLLFRRRRLLRPGQVNSPGQGSYSQ